MMFKNHNNQDIDIQINENEEQEEYKIDIDQNESKMNITGNLLSSFGTQINNEELISSDEQSQIVSSNILQQ